MDGHARVVARRHHLHRRVIQERGEAHVREGRVASDPAGLFNSSLDGNVRRAIDIKIGEEVDAAAFKALVRDAIALNGAKARSTKAAKKKKAAR